MGLVDIFRPYSLYCDVGKTQATVMVPVDADMRDNVESHVSAPCSGCNKWSLEKIRRTEREIREETLAQFGRDDDSLTGIRDGRQNQLEQLLVDIARFKRDESHRIVVGMCTPITKGE